MTNIVLYSGGLGSFLAAYLIQKQYPSDKLVLYFNDTKTEDPDLYRFLHESADLLGVAVTEDSDGRDVWQVFRDRKFVANSRVDTCSDVLKRRRAHDFVSQFDPSTTRVVIGIDWTEIHRYEKAKPLWQPYELFAPLCEDLRDKGALFKEAVEALGAIRLPSLYSYGFPHNNCGGFCVKAGLTQFKLLWESLPDRYLEHEWAEEYTYRVIGSRRPFLRKTVGGRLYYITMREYRHYLETGELKVNGTVVIGYGQLPPATEETDDFGGCGCAI